MFKNRNLRQAHEMNGLFVDHNGGEFVNNILPEKSHLTFAWLLALNHCPQLRLTYKFTAK